MSWRQASRRDLAALLEFLLPEEALFVPFTSRLRAGTRGFEVYLDTDQGGAVRDCFLHTSTGLLLPAFSADVPGGFVADVPGGFVADVPGGFVADVPGGFVADGPDSGELALLLRSLRPTVHSIMGAGRCVELVERSLPHPPTTRVEYFLMTLAADSRHPVLAPDPADLRVRRADAYDAELLFPLQKCYELEEVVIAPAHFNEGQCMKSLRQALREQLVYLAELRGVPVAKAATNARGYKVDQVGGVYTVPEERGKGLGKAVVSQLLKTVFSEKQGACLFVKKHNRAAIALYERLGFAPATDYIISYYGL